MRADPESFHQRQKFDLHTIATEKLKKDLKELENLLSLTEVREGESVVIRRELKRVCAEFNIHNPYLDDNL
jgi:hypothetical protein